MRRSISRQQSGAFPPPLSSSNLQNPSSAITAPQSNKKQWKRCCILRPLFLRLISLVFLTFFCLARLHSSVSTTKDAGVESGNDKNHVYEADNSNYHVECYNHGQTFPRIRFASLEKKANSVYELAAKLAQTEEVSPGEIETISQSVHELNQFIRHKLAKTKETKTHENTGLGTKAAIFFNTFQNRTSTELANQIIKDQLQKINAQKLLFNSTIFYSRFGDHTTTPFPVSVCENNNQRRCVQVAAKDEGDEMYTLQYLYDYCSTNLDDIAIYIHTKGSYTPSKENNLLRDILMKAVTSEECLNIHLNSCSAGIDRDSISGSCCHTCSTQFHGLPSHYPGNMWVAQCEYVSKLIPPNEFESKKRNVLQQIKEGTEAIKDSNFFHTTLKNGLTFKFHKSKSWMLESESMLGIKRFAMEQWIGSHPDISPCEVFSPKDGVPLFRYGTIEQKGINAATLVPARRFAPGVNFQEFWKDKSFKLHPIFLKAGRIFDYNVLYSKEPDQSSWFHSFWDNK